MQNAFALNASENKMNKDKQKFKISEQISQKFVEVFLLSFQQKSCLLNISKQFNNIRVFTKF
jgi:hypothetical protein